MKIYPGDSTTSPQNRSHISYPSVSWSVVIIQIRCNWTRSINQFACVSYYRNAAQRDAFIPYHTYIYVQVQVKILPRYMYTLKTILQHKRHVSVSHWDPSNVTHFSTGILTRIAPVILVKIPVEMCRITRISMTRFNVSFMLQNFSQYSLVIGFA